MRPTKFIKMAVLTAAAAVCLQVFAPARAQEAATQPTSAPTSGPSDRQMAIIQELQGTMQELQLVITGPDDLMSKEKREAAAPKAVPLMKKAIKLADELMAMPGPAGQMAGRLKNQFKPVLIGFDDAETIQALEAASKGDNKQAGLEAKSSLLLGSWFKTNGDAAAQTKVLDEVTALAKANTDSNELTMVIGAMGELMPANAELKTRARDVVKNEMKSDAAKEMSEQFKQQEEAEAKLKANENTPIKLAGPTYDGKTLNLEELKGKVVLIDFWATWCAPCRAETPLLIETYKKYKDKGFEIVGVSCDNGAEEIAEYVKDNPGFSWPQMFDAKNPGWHAAAKELNVMMIPAMFLVDKKGVVRTVDAKAKLDETITKLLAE